MPAPRLASLLLTLAALPMTLGLAGCGTLTAISIVPGAGSTTLNAIGQTAQFRALGASQMGSAAPTTSDITGSVTWAVSNTNVVTVTSTGLVTAVGPGYSQVTAQSSGVFAQSDVTVSASATANPTASPLLSITPGSAAETFAGETTQFTASGNLSGTGASQNLTALVQWSSSNSQVATISNGGLATAAGAGTTIITASSGTILATATLTVTAASTPASITIIPSSGATASFTGETTQFIAIGNLTGAASVQNITSSVAWYSSDVAVATIDQNGLATAVSANTAPAITTITAIGTPSGGGPVVIGTTSLNVLPSGGTVNLPTLAVYTTGLGTGAVTGTVSNATNNLACLAQSSGTVCTGTFPLNSTVTLTAAASSATTPASSFGGWSNNCTPVPGNAAQCTIKMNNNQTVGAIFNKP